MSATPDVARQVHVALLLSGGGFRAALFHLGVLRALHEEGLLSRDAPVRIRLISGVSGGGIVAAHCVRHWRRYTGDCAAFEGATQELIALAQSDLRGRTTRRLGLYVIGRTLSFPFKAIASAITGLFPSTYSAWSWLQHVRWKPSVTSAFSAILEAGLFADSAPGRRSTLDALEPGQDNEPELFLLATNLTTGTSCSFTPRGLLDHAQTPADPIGERAGGAVIRIADAVSASACFPGYFPPLALPRRTIDNSEEDPKFLFLADGGICDNVGAFTLSQLGALDRADLVIVSDASAGIQANHRLRLGWLFFSSLRSIDLLSKQRAADVRAPSRREGRGLPISNLSLVYARDRVDPAILSRLARLRTDFDRFSDVEVVQLVEAGYWAMRSVFPGAERASGSAAPQVAAWPLKNKAAVLKQGAGLKTRTALESGSLRPLSIIELRDPVFWAQLIVVLAIVTTFIAYVDIRIPVLWKPSIQEAARQERAAMFQQLQGQAFAAGTRSFLAPTTSKVENPNYDGTRFGSDHRIWDLRDIPRGREGNGASFILSRVVEVSEHAMAPATFSVLFRSVGEIHLDEPVVRTREGISIPCTFDIQVDTWDEAPENVRRLGIRLPQGTRGFVLSSRATFSGGCDRFEDRWVGAMTPHRDPGSLRLSLVFDEAIDPGVVSRARKPIGGGDEELTLEGDLIVDPRNLWIDWTIDSPESGYIYKLYFEGVPITPTQDTEAR